MLFALNLSPPVLAGLLGGLLVGITFHEFSHAFVADQLGDHRACGPWAAYRSTRSATSTRWVRSPCPASASAGASRFRWLRAALRSGRNGHGHGRSGRSDRQLSLVALAFAALFRLMDLDAGGDGTAAPPAFQFLYSAVAINLLLAS